MLRIAKEQKIWYCTVKRAKWCWSYIRIRLLVLGRWTPRVLPGRPCFVEYFGTKKKKINETGPVIHEYQMLHNYALYSEGSSCTLTPRPTWARERGRLKLVPLDKKVMNLLTESLPRACRQD